MKITDLQYGDVINSYWPKLKWYDIPGRCIQGYQKDKYGNDSLWKATHSVIFLGGTRFFEVTDPYARYGDLIDDWEEGRTYTVSRYRWWIPQAERSAIESVCQRLNGTRYDYFQLIDIALKQAMGWSFTRPLRIFDLSRRRKVCSVAVAGCYVNWWELYGKDAGVPRPLGEQDVEVCCPADFDNKQEYFSYLGYLEAP